MVTIGSQASGDTGLKIWISGLSAAFTVGDRPQSDAERHGDQRRDQEAERTPSSGWCRIWSMIGRLAGVVAAT